MDTNIATKKAPTDPKADWGHCKSRGYIP